MKTVLVPFQRDVAPSELPEGLHDEIVGLGSDTLIEQDLGFVVRVAILPLDELSQGVVVVVDQGILQVPLGAVQDHDLVNLAPGVVAGLAVPQQAQLVVGIPAGMVDHSAEDVVVAGNPPARARFILHGAAHLGGQLRRGALVGINEEDPVGIHSIQGGIALLGEVLKPVLQNRRPRPLRELHRSILAEGVEHHHLIGPLHAGDALRDIPLLVFGEDNDG